MKLRYWSIFLLFCVFSLQAQHDKAFVIYNTKGKAVKYKDLKSKSLAGNVVLFGEYHDNPIVHWLQLELTQDAYAQHGANLMLGFEMFEQDQQAVLNRYLQGAFPEKSLKDSLRLWPNYETDYAPLIEFAKTNKLPCIADNIQRKYASLMFKKGRTAFDTLAPSILQQMADPHFEIDTNLSQYKELKEMASHMPAGMGGAYMLESQAFKDATMAKFMLSNMKPISFFMHYNGAYHSDFYQGIMWYLLKSKPELRITTISTVTQGDINSMDKEHLGRADFIICVPENMTKTH
ncbi:MAG: ChaN family lipoprotein [Bacteroidota bacterium]